MQNHKAPNLRFSVIHDDHLSFPTNSFSAIRAEQALFNLASPLQTLEQWQRILTLEDDLSFSTSIGVSSRSAQTLPVSFMKFSHPYLSIKTTSPSKEPLELCHSPEMKLLQSKNFRNQSQSLELFTELVWKPLLSIQEKFPFYSDTRSRPFPGRPSQNISKRGF